jgi:serine protease Do
MRRRHWLPMVLTGAGGLLGGGLVQLAWQQPPVVQAQAPLPVPPARLDDSPAKPSGDDFEPAVQKVMPALVAVEAVKSAGRIKPSEESGSGVLMKFDGFRGVFAVTNNHVVEGAKASDITVTLYDGRILTPDRVWTDPASDIAILRLEADNLPTAELGDSDKVKPGHWVLAFGSPLGFNQTVTHGIISARDRGQVTLNNTIRIKEFLQSDAAINPGSSGGPLSDRTGKIIGINTAIASGGNANTTFAGISFSIPINLVKRLGREMLDKGTVQRGYLGLQMSNALDAKMALKLGLTKLRGAMIEAPHKGGPGERAGLQTGDVIQKVDGLDIRDENQFINIVGTLPVGESLKLTIWRNKQSKDVTLTVADWPVRK